MRCARSWPRPRSRPKHHGARSIDRHRWRTTGTVGGREARGPAECAAGRYERECFGFGVRLFLLSLCGRTDPALAVLRVPRGHNVFARSVSEALREGAQERSSELYVEGFCAAYHTHTRARVPLPYSCTVGVCCHTGVARRRFAPSQERPLKGSMTRKKIKRQLLRTFKTYYYLSLCNPLLRLFPCVGERALAARATACHWRRCVLW